MIVSDSTTGPGSWRGAEPGPGWHWVRVPCLGVRSAAVSVDPEVYVADTIEVWHFPRVDRAATATFTSMPVGGLLRGARRPAVLPALIASIDGGSR
jgi:hypothetical protein